MDQHVGPYQSWITRSTVRMNMFEEDNTVKSLLEVFQVSQERGEWAKFFLESRNGQTFISFSSQLPVESPTGAVNEEVKRKKWKYNTIVQYCILNTMCIYGLNSEPKFGSMR